MKALWVKYCFVSFRKLLFIWNKGQQMRNIMNLTNILTNLVINVMLLFTQLCTNFLMLSPLLHCWHWQPSNILQCWEWTSQFGYAYQHYYHHHHNHHQHHLTHYNHHMARNPIQYGGKSCMQSAN